MKRGLKVFASLVSLFVIGLPAFAQPSSKSITTFDMENFDSVGEQNYLCDGEYLNWEWGVTASRFVADGYPKMIYHEGSPDSLRQLKLGSDEKLLALGIKTAFNRKGDNWFEVFPTKDGKNYEIPFIGTVDHVDFWVWGAGYNYYLELMVRDANGTTRVLPAGTLAFHGWKNIIVNIPGWIQQVSNLRSGRKHMTLVGFRVRSDAEEKVDDFAIWFDEIKYTTNSLSYIYDGYELNSVDFGDSEGSSSSSNSSNEDTVEVSE